MCQLFLEAFPQPLLISEFPIGVFSVLPETYVPNTNGHEITQVMMFPLFAEL
jgi:hypothetical protein